MPLKKTCSVSAFKDNISFLYREGYEQDQAVAIAFETLRKACGAPPRAKEQQWTPEEIVAYKKRKSEGISDCGCGGQNVIKEVIDDMNEQELQMLLRGLSKVKEDLPMILRRYGVTEELGVETEVGPKGIGDVDVEEEGELDASDIEKDLTSKVSEGVVEALAEYFRDLDFEKIKDVDLRNILKQLSSVLYKLSRRFPILARREIRMLKTRGPEGFLRWFRSQMLK